MSFPLYSQARIGLALLAAASYAHAQTPPDAGALRQQIAWELGANLGHIGTFLPIARALRERRYEVQWVVAQPHRAARLLPMWARCFRFDNPQIG